MASLKGKRSIDTYFVNVSWTYVSETLSRQSWRWVQSFWFLLNEGKTVVNVNAARRTVPLSLVNNQDGFQPSVEDLMVNLSHMPSLGPHSAATAGTVSCLFPGSNVYLFDVSFCFHFEDLAVGVSEAYDV